MSAARPNTWMPTYWGDYLKDTMHLRAEGHGAYLLLIANYWITGKPLPANDDHLMAIARVEAKSWRRLKPILAAFFTVTECEWIHARIDRELARATDISEKRRIAGKEGGKQSANLKANGKQDNEQKPTQSPSPSHPPKEFKNSSSEGKALIVKSATIEKAREIAPGYDVYYVEQCWKDYNAGKTVIDPDKAFLGFLRTHVERNPLP